MNSIKNSDKKEWTYEMDKACVKGFLKFIDFDKVLNSDIKRKILIFMKSCTIDFLDEKKVSYERKCDNLNYWFRDYFKLPLKGLSKISKQAKEILIIEIQNSKFKNSNFNDFSSSWKNSLEIKYSDKEINKEIEEAQNYARVVNGRSSKQQLMWKIELLNSRGIKCEVNSCKIKNTKLLIASHIKPYSKCAENEHYDLSNGLLLCPTHDKLFDAGLITIDFNGRINFNNNELTINDFISADITTDSKIELKNKENFHEYIDFHNNFVFKK